MKEFTLRFHGEQAQSKIFCGEGIFDEMYPALAANYPQVFILTDETVFSVYKETFGRLAGNPRVYAMPAGEEHKQPNTLIEILRAMAAAGLHRGDCLFAVGGGVVGDIGGLASALYMRGIDCVQVPTTLLSQVDSSVGGKTAVDLDGVKNIVGAFKQPNTVLVDGSFLKTLPAREVRCGLGEIVKHGALNGALFDKLIENRDRLFDLAFLNGVVPDNIAHKAFVVQEDEKESGLRKSLNLGHTTGHALELFDAELSHGEYVLLGLLFEAELAKSRVLCDKGYLKKLQELIYTALGGKPGLPQAEEAACFAKLDKKNAISESVVITAPVAKGEYALLEIPYAEYARELREIRERLQ